MLELFPVAVFKKKNNSQCWHIQWQSKPSLKLLDFGRKIQNDVHINTYYCKPELISWRQINITEFSMPFLSPTDQKCAESSTYWQFFYYHSPDKFRYSAREINKIWCQELDKYVHEFNIDMTLLIIDIVDSQYRFSISVQPDIAPFSQYLFNVKKMAIKICKSWQVCDWLAKWLVMLGFMDLRRLMISRRSNVGLVLH